MSQFHLPQFAYLPITCIVTEAPTAKSEAEKNWEVPKLRAEGNSWEAERKRKTHYTVHKEFGI